jgi:branched-chain amino acid transport system ATP-binding protein
MSASQPLPSHEEAEPESDELALVIKGLYSGYGRADILRDVSLHVGRSEAVGIVGANGAGKTTLLRTICGTLGVRAGEVIWYGDILKHRTASRLASAGLVHVPEGSCVFPTMSVRENMEIGALAIGRRPKPAEFQGVFDLFPVLGERRSQRAGNLSGGEQRMLAIGRGLLMRPKLLVLDEPSTGLASIVIQQLGRALKLLHEGGLAILMAEQNLGLVEMVSERAYLLERGRFAWVGTPDNISDNAVVTSSVVGGGRVT